MGVFDRLLWFAGDLFLLSGFDRGLDIFGRTEGRGGKGWVRVYEGPQPDTQRVAGRILKDHLPCGLHRTSPGRSEVVVRTAHLEQALAVVEALGLEAQT